MTLTVKLFAAARDLAKADSVAIELPAGATVAHLRTELARRVPSLAALLAKSALAVNYDFAENEHGLASGDEVALIPPVSGG
jgi:molybdopterin converting factor subunit 1